MLKQAQDGGDEADEAGPVVGSLKREYCRRAQQILARTRWLKLFVNACVAELKGELRWYQQEAVEWLAGNFRRGVGSIIAFEMVSD